MLVDIHDVAYMGMVTNVMNVCCVGNTCLQHDSCAEGESHGAQARQALQLPPLCKCNILVELHRTGCAPEQGPPIRGRHARFQLIRNKEKRREQFSRYSRRKVY